MAIELRYIEYPPPMPVIATSGSWSHEQSVGSLELTPTIVLVVSAVARKGQGYVRLQLFQRHPDGSVTTRGAPFAVPAWTVADVGRLLQAAGEEAGQLPGVVAQGETGGR